MLGMNDVGRSLYASESKDKPGNTERQKEAIKRNLENMDKLAAKLNQDGTRIIFITPSLFDQTGNQDIDPQVGVNDALLECADSLKELSMKYNASIVDFNGPMAAINAARQAQDPNFTIVGRDRVHPGPVGHMVMAYLFLKAQGAPSLVSMIEIDASKSVVIRQENCGISGLNSGGEVSFSVLAQSLPFPVSANAREALVLIPFTEEMNREFLIVTGLKEGAYELSIDGKSVYTGDATSFSEGINLALIEKTPQYQHASVVQKLINEQTVAIRTLRNIAQVEHGSAFRDLKDDSINARIAHLRQLIEELAKGDAPRKDYMTRLYETYIQNKPREHEVMDIVERLAAEIYRANAPKSRRYSLQFRY